MPENPYAAPHAQSAQTAAVLAEAPDTILRKIAAGWIVASLMALINLALGVRAFLGDDVFEGIAYGLGTLLVAGLAYGTYRKSRIAACLQLAVYVLIRIGYLLGGSINGLGIAVLIALAYLSAARGTFQYHRWLQQERRFPSSQRPRLSDDPLFRTPAIPPSPPSTSAESNNAATTASAPAAPTP